MAGKGGLPRPSAASRRSGGDRPLGDAGHPEGGLTPRSTVALGRCVSPRAGRSAEVSRRPSARTQLERHAQTPPHADPRQAACACEEFKRSWTLTDCLRGGLGFKCCWGAHAANPRLPPGRADSSSYDGPSVCAGFASLEPTSVGSNMVPGRRVYSGQLQHAPRQALLLGLPIRRRPRRGRDPAAPGRGARLGVAARAGAAGRKGRPPPPRLAGTQTATTRASRPQPPGRASRRPRPLAAQRRHSPLRVHHEGEAR